VRRKAASDAREASRPARNLRRSAGTRSVRKKKVRVRKADTSGLISSLGP
jgi:hypothetical protein